MHKRAQSIVSLVTALAFAFTQGITPSVVWAVEGSAPREVRVESRFDLALPPELGTIQTITSGSGPTLIHIQTAHGNYEAQKKIQALLHYLKDHYGIKTVLVEGSASELDPNRLRFFAKKMDLTMKILDDLTKQALVKGAELFLVEDSEARAYGIEDIDAYVANGEAFKAVLTQQEKTEGFIRDMDMQIERLTSPYLNKDLRAFLKTLERFDAKTLPLMEWLTYLKGEAKKTLGIDLSDPAWQIDWPMLLRVFKLKEFEVRLDPKAFEKERAEFLSVIQKAPGAQSDLVSEIEKLLSSPLAGRQLPDPETGLLFEKMVSALPKDFNYDATPNVKVFIGHLILQSEVKGGRLMEEMNRLTEEVSARLARTEVEKKILALLKDHRLLKRLFALELTPEDYAAITAASSLGPSEVIKRFQELNASGRVRDVQFSHLEEIDSLFEKALEFYRGVKARDGFMLENIESRLKETGVDKAVVITGGFHAGPFSDYFQKRGFNYALVAPKITTLEGRDLYVKATLLAGWNFIRSSTIEGAFLEDTTLRTETVIPSVATTLGKWVVAEGNFVIKDNVSVHRANDYLVVEALLGHNAQVPITTSGTSTTLTVTEIKKPVIAINQSLPVVVTAIPSAASDTPRSEARMKLTPDLAEELASSLEQQVKPVLSHAYDVASMQGEISKTTVLGQAGRATDAVALTLRKLASIIRERKEATSSVPVGDIASIIEHLGEVQSVLTQYAGTTPNRGKAFEAVNGALVSLRDLEVVVQSSKGGAIRLPGVVVDKKLADLPTRSEARKEPYLVKRISSPAEEAGASRFTGDASRVFPRSEARNNEVLYERTQLIARSTSGSSYGVQVRLVKKWQEETELAGYKITAELMRSAVGSHDEFPEGVSGYQERWDLSRIPTSKETALTRLVNEIIIVAIKSGPGVDQPPDYRFEPNQIFEWFRGPQGAVQDSFQAAQPRAPSFIHNAGKLIEKFERDNQLPHADLGNRPSILESFKRALTLRSEARSKVKKSRLVVTINTKDVKAIEIDRPIKTSVALHSIVQGAEGIQNFLQAAGVYTTLTEPTKVVILTQAGLGSAVVGFIDAIPSGSLNRRMIYLGPPEDKDTLVSNVFGLLNAGQDIDTAQDEQVRRSTSNVIGEIPSFFKLKNNADGSQTITITPRAARSEARSQGERELFVGGNWKMAVNDPREAAELLYRVAKEIRGVEEQGKVAVMLAPSNVHIGGINALLVEDRSRQTGSRLFGKILLGAQDVSEKPPGAATGQTSAEQLNALGVTSVIIGHSERRRGVMAETSELVNKKVKRALEVGLDVVVAVGESSEERVADKTVPIILDQTTKSLAGLTADQMLHVVVAYEPVWAIGTGKTATPQEANDIHLIIRKILDKLFDTKTAQETRIIYGGSVTPENIAELIAQPDIDGALVGGASLKSDKFVSIVRSVRAARSEARMTTMTFSVDVEDVPVLGESPHQFTLGGRERDYRFNVAMSRFDNDEAAKLELENLRRAIAGILRDKKGSLDLLLTNPDRHLLNTFDIEVPDASLASYGLSLQGNGKDGFVGIIRSPQDGKRIVANVTIDFSEISAPATEPAKLRRSEARSANALNQPEPASPQELRKQIAVLSVEIGNAEGNMNTEEARRRAPDGMEEEAEEGIAAGEGFLTNKIAALVAQRKLLEKQLAELTAKTPPTASTSVNPQAAVASEASVASIERKETLPPGTNRAEVRMTEGEKGIVRDLSQAITELAVNPSLFTQQKEAERIFNALTKKDQVPEKRDEALAEAARLLSSFQRQGFFHPKPVTLEFIAALTQATAPVVEAPAAATQGRSEARAAATVTVALPNGTETAVSFTSKETFVKEVKKIFPRGQKTVVVTLLPSELVEISGRVTLEKVSGPEILITQLLALPEIGPELLKKIQRDNPSLGTNKDALTALEEEVLLLILIERIEILEPVAAEDTVELLPLTPVVGEALVSDVKEERSEVREPATAEVTPVVGTVRPETGALTSPPSSVRKTSPPSPEAIANTPRPPEDILKPVNEGPLPQTPVSVAPGLDRFPRFDVTHVAPGQAELTPIQISTEKLRELILSLFRFPTAAAQEEALIVFGIPKSHPAFGGVSVSKEPSVFQAASGEPGPVEVEFTPAYFETIRARFATLSPDHLGIGFIDSSLAEAMIRKPSVLLAALSVGDVIRKGKKPVLVLEGDPATLQRELKNALTNPVNGLTGESRVKALDLASRLNEVVKIVEPGVTALNSYAQANPGVVVTFLSKVLDGLTDKEALNLVIGKKLEKDIAILPALIAEILLAAASKPAELQQAELIREIGIVVNIVKNGNQSFFVVQTFAQFAERLLRSELRVRISA
ncbi:MAG: triose-phosphate isomerase [Candidatus Omnitrophica bacterium]|nr:triose-phosphate isomerase [Candidatus Omnitrophota bacterium]